MTKAVENGRRFAAGDDRVLPEISIGREDDLADAVSRPGSAPVSSPTLLLGIKPLLTPYTSHSEGRNAYCSFDVISYTNPANPTNQAFKHPPVNLETGCLRDAQELEVLRLKEGHSVADALRKNCLELGSERRVGVSTGEVRLRHVRDRGARVSKHRRPLLHRLVEVLWVEGRVTETSA